MAIDWSKKKILVAGGGGLIGSHLARTLADKGAEVCVADNLSSGSAKNIEDIKDRVEVVSADLRQESICKNLSKGKDYVVHSRIDHKTWMDQMVNAFVKGDTGAHGENQYCYDETPEIDLFTVAEGEPVICGPFRPP